MKSGCLEQIPAVDNHVKRLLGMKKQFGCVLPTEAKIALATLHGLSFLGFIFFARPGMVSKDKSTAFLSCLLQRTELHLVTLNRSLVSLIMIYSLGISRLVRLATTIRRFAFPVDLVNTVGFTSNFHVVIYLKLAMQALQHYISLTQSRLLHLLRNREPSLTNSHMTLILRTWNRLINFQ